MPPNDKGPAAVPTPDRLAYPADDHTSLADDSIAVDVDMADALDQARARWATAAVIAERSVLAADGRQRIVRFVGRLCGPASWAVLGRGQTWRDAFDDADLRTGGGQ